MKIEGLDEALEMFEESRKENARKRKIERRKGRRENILFWATVIGAIGTILGVLYNILME